ncbi:MAG: undecaprenyl-diphosphate phosphatase [Alphaproteobacteria bacterium]|nr:undecaprenyl-diphosphate phosphatase [Alphaproteobacteria bacterium]
MFEIVVLALLQSITEFLPVSSSGHLVVVREFFGWNAQGLGLLSDLGLHIGTLGAVCVYFMKDLIVVLKGLYTKGTPRNLLTCLFLGTLPIVVVGILFGEKIEFALRSVPVVAIMLIVFGVVLYQTDKLGSRRKVMSEMTYRDALIIGSAQCIALIPGVSRSGITMSFSRLLGYGRSDSARFSMLLSIPAILGATGYYFLRLFFRDNLSGLPNSFYWGVLLSFFGGLFAVSFLMSWVKKHSFYPFMIYRVVLGGFLLFLFYFS